MSWVMNSISAMFFGLLKPPQQVEHLRLCRYVERSGRFVGDQQCPVSQASAIAMHDALPQTRR
jgi:hypothetical protein